MGILLIENLEEQEVAEIHSYIKFGGHWKPKNCLAKHKVSCYLFLFLTHLLINIIFNQISQMF